MQKAWRFHPGFTLIELAIVIVVLGLLSLVAFPFLSTSIGRTELKTTGWEVSDILRRAQAQSMSGENDTNWGVHLISGGYTLFQGNTYSPADPDNIDYFFPNRISIINVSVNGGGSDIRFLRTSGRTSDFGTVTLLDNTSNDTLVITVTQEGNISF